MPKSKTPSPLDVTSDPASEGPRSFRHPLVRHLRNCYRTRKIDREGFLVSQEWQHLALKTGPACFDRSCRTWDQILARLEDLGHKTVVEPEGTFALIGEQRVKLAMYEKKVRSDHVLTSNEMLDLKLRPGSTLIPKFDFQPTGKLVFRAEAPFVREALWQEGERKAIEEMLDSIVTGIVEVAAKNRARLIEHHEQRRRDEEAHMRRWEDVRRIEDLNRQVVAWQQSQLIKKYVAAAREAGRATESWEAWALAYADRIDPLHAG